jgi:hypothetical protein
VGGVDLAVWILWGGEVVGWGRKVGKRKVGESFRIRNKGALWWFWSAGYCG